MTEEDVGVFLEIISILRRVNRQQGTAQVNTTHIKEMGGSLTAGGGVCHAVNKLWRSLPHVSRMSRAYVGSRAIRQSVEEKLAARLGSQCSSVSNSALNSRRSLQAWSRILSENREGIFAVRIRSTDIKNGPFVDYIEITQTVYWPLLRECCAISSRETSWEQKWFPWWSCSVYACYPWTC